MVQTYSIVFRLGFTTAVAFCMLGYAAADEPAGQCVVDTPDRLLSIFFDLGDNNTPEACIEKCKTYRGKGFGDTGYKYAGVEYGAQCFCGDCFNGEVKEVPESECNSPCGGDANQNCGGPLRLNLYST